ncbi:MAG TPA: lactate permease LctP family transporter [Bryobacteraceae bacterium]|nr:lactate permease LctP family transporter [Bryobacteraceae bacterium]
MPWYQVYDPLGNVWLSTISAALPVCLLFYLLAIRRTPAHWAAVYASLLCIALAAFEFHMPPGKIAGAAVSGMVYGIVRIAWTLLAAVYVYELTVESGRFEVIKQSIGGVTKDRRLQTLLIAFAFGSVLEGAGGGGSPVAICGAMMVGLGFDPIAAAVLCLIANTAPVAFGAVGNPVRALMAVTGLPGMQISATMGRILPWTALILPFWMTRMVTSWRNVFAIWPGLLMAGGAFAAIQFYWSNYVDYGLVDIVGGMFTLIALTFFLKAWKPREIWHFASEPAPTIAVRSHSFGEILHAWTGFLLLSLFVIVTGIPSLAAWLNASSPVVPMPGLHNLVFRMPPVFPKPHAEAAILDLTWLSNAGTGAFIAGLIAGPIMGLTFRDTIRIFFRTCYRMRYSMLAIMAMLVLGYVTRYSGMDAVLGLAMTHTGRAFPFFGTLIGWIGVSLTGTDAGSNALFGSLQVITAGSLGLPPVLMAAANSAGGVMGKMIAAQSLVVAAVAVGKPGSEGELFRRVFPHSIILASIVGLIVLFLATAGRALVP